MNNRWMSVLVGAIIAALLVGASALGAILVRPGVTQAAQAGSGFVRQITVVGNGEATGTPDRASVQLGVQSEAATAREALTDNSTKMATLIQQLKELGIADNDIQTSNFSVSPTYGENGRTVSGYQVSNSVAVTIRDVSKAGTLLDQIVSAGANTIYGISFSIADPKSLQTSARDAALTDARARAEAMAKTLGGSVGQVLSVTENIGQASPVMMERAAMDMAAAGSAAPIQAGEQTINAQVQVTYELR